MNFNNENAQTIIERDVHCPYCDSDKALLISELADKRSVLKMPDLDRKYWLSLIFTFGLYAFVHGFPFIEKKRVYDYNTYGFARIAVRHIMQAFPILLQQKSEKRYIAHFVTKRYLVSVVESLNTPAEMLQRYA